MSGVAPARRGRPSSGRTMIAAYSDRYGAPEILRIGEVDRPAAEPREVIVRVRAASLNPADWRVLGGDPYLAQLAFGIRRPRTRLITGSDVAGEVVEVGREVTTFHVGDRVFGETGTGACAEFVAVPERRLARMPANLGFDTAAAVPMAAVTALQALRDRGRIASGQRLLVNGASGGIGTFAVQLATAFGAEVTAVCSGRNAELVSSIGAQRVIDYTSSDFAASERGYDVVVDTVGNRSLRDLGSVPSRRGTLVLVGGGGGRWLGPAAQQLRALLVSPFVTQSLRPVTERPNSADLGMIASLIDEGRVRPVIDRTYPFAETATALRHVRDGHARGKVVVTM